MEKMNLVDLKRNLLAHFDISDEISGVSTGTNWLDSRGDISVSNSPIDGKHIASVKNASIDDYELVFD